MRGGARSRETSVKWPQIIEVKPRALLRRLKLNYRKLRRELAGKFDIVDQHIPLQAVNRTVFEYNLTWYGEDEFQNYSSDQKQKYDRYPRLKAHLISQVFPSSYKFVVSDARITSGSIDVIDPKRPNRVFLELYSSLTPPRSNRWVNNQFRRDKISAGVGIKGKSIGKAFIFSPMYCKNYFHFVIDGCARFVDLEEHGFLGDMTLLHSQAPNKWQSEYLSILGLHEPFEILPPSTAADFVNVGNLLISSPSRHQYLASRRALLRLRERVLRGVGRGARRLESETCTSLAVTPRFAGS